MCRQAGIDLGGALRLRTRAWLAGASWLALAALVGCSPGDADLDGAAGGGAVSVGPSPVGEGENTGSVPSEVQVLDGGAGAIQAPAIPGETALPEGAIDPTDPESCDDGLIITVRDFKPEHPDFESYNSGVRPGLVEPLLDAESKPVHAGTAGTDATSGPDSFRQWYRDVSGVNMTVPVTISFDEVEPGRFVYDNSEFFPVDGMGFGNGPEVGGIPVVGSLLGVTGDTPHNFLFTTEAHTRFTYQGGEVFTFRGDDDLWIFINQRLAIDLGGVHGAEEQVLDLDAAAAELGIVVGATYPMDIFHAERHTTQSNFRIETTIDFSCIENVVIK